MVECSSRTEPDDKFYEYPSDVETTLRIPNPNDDNIHLDDDQLPSKIIINSFFLVYFFLSKKSNGAMVSYTSFAQNQGILDDFHKFSENLKNTMFFYWN